MTEIEPAEGQSPNRWQYRAVTDIAIDTSNLGHYQDSPWWWRHYNENDTRPDFQDIDCDDTLRLFPADPDSPDTTISADGQTLTVNVYQVADSVWVCFAVKCADNTYAYAKIRNTQTQSTINSGPCGQGIPGSRSRITRPDQPAIDPLESNNNPNPSRVDSGPDFIDNTDPNSNTDPNGQGSGETGPADGRDESDNTGSSGGQNNQQDQGGSSNNPEPNSPTPPPRRPLDKTPSK